MLERTALAVICVALVADVVFATETVGAGTAGASVLAAYLAVLLGAAGIVVGRRVPVVGVVLMAAAPLLPALLGWDPIAAWSIACFAALWFTLRGLRGLVVALVLGAANLVAAGLYAGTLDPSQDTSASIAGAVAVMMAAAGSAVRSNRQYALSLEERARQAMATQEAVAERSVAEERVRIARDLHDSVGHRVAVMSMHLGAAEVRLPAGADQTRADLALLREDVQAVLSETQQILRVLRVGPSSADGDPTAGIERIDELVESYRGAGLRLEGAVSTAGARLSQTASAAAFRITQEALTNAQKHGTGSASLSIEVLEHGGLAIEVMNLRRADPAPGPGDGGHGLVGMGERAESAGGHLDTGGDGRMFWIRAELPGSGEKP
ncbi:MAG TPA: histidine kinase [Cellulomonas sp.]